MLFPAFTEVVGKLAVAAFANVAPLLAEPNTDVETVGALKRLVEAAPSEAWMGGAIGRLFRQRGYVTGPRGITYVPMVGTAKLPPVSGAGGRAGGVGGSGAGGAAGSSDAGPGSGFHSTSTNPRADAMTRAEDLARAERLMQARRRRQGIHNPGASSQGAMSAYKLSYELSTRQPSQHVGTGG
jgi:hypothetical protein